MSSEAVVAFRNALRSGDTAGAIERFDEFDEVLDTLSARESAVQDAARGIIARIPQKKAVHQAAQQYLKAVFEAQQKRVEAKNDFLLHLEGGPDGPRVADRVDAVINANQKVRKLEEEIRDKGPVSIPALVRVFGSNTIKVPKGETINSTFTATNTGFGTASDLAVSVKGYSVSITPTSIQSLSGGESTQLQISGTAATEANTVIQVIVGSESTQARLQVLNKVDYLNNSINLIDSLDQRLDKIEDSKEKDKNKGKDKGNQRSGTSSGVKGLENKVDKARKRVNKIINSIPDKNPDKINEKIRSVINFIGSFINQVEGHTPQHINKRTSAILIQDAKQLINTLDSAIEAEV